MNRLYDSDSIITNLKEGSIVAYRLKSSDIPANPLQIWRGVVLRYNDTCILVESLERGYRGLREIVFYYQIVAVQ